MKRLFSIFIVSSCFVEIAQAEQIDLLCSGVSVSMPDRDFSPKEIRDIPVTLFTDEGFVVFSSFRYDIKYFDNDVLISQSSDPRAVAGFMLDMSNGDFWETQIGSQCVGGGCAEITVGGGYIEGRCRIRPE